VHALASFLSDAVGERAPFVVECSRSETGPHQADERHPGRVERDAQGIGHVRRCGIGNLSEVFEDRDLIHRESSRPEDLIVRCWDKYGRRETGVKSGTYELIPFKMYLPAIPRVADGSLPVDQIRMNQGIPVAGGRIEACTIEGASREAAELLEACKARVAHGENRALTELLNANPAFIADRWVRETLGQLIENGVPLRRRGRIRGKHHFHPLIVVGLVEYLLDKKAVKSINQAFRRLDELKILAFHAAKELYYRTRREERFRPILLQFPEQARLASREELAALFPRGVEVLEAGSSIQRTFQAADGRQVEMTFQGLL